MRFGVFLFLSAFSLSYLGLVPPLGLFQKPAQAATGWALHGDMMKTRIITGENTATGKGAEDERILLAWEAELAEGWKTYWRSPGEAGLPVRVSVGGREIEILYPYPQRFELFGIETYGYSKSVILPFYLEKVPENREGDEFLVKVSFMICKDICVPYEKDYTVTGEDLASGGLAEQIRIQNWLKRVPDKKGGGGAGLDIKSVSLTGMVGHQRLIVDAVAAQPLTQADMLAEVAGGFHFGSPLQQLKGGGNAVRFILPAMATKNAGSLAGKTVRLTFSDGQGHAIDRSFTLTP